jgi:hypothetical protein
VSTELELHLDPAIREEFGTHPSDARMTRTSAALEANGIYVLGQQTRPRRS